MSTIDLAKKNYVFHQFEIFFLNFISVFHMEFHLEFHVEIVPSRTPNKKIFFLKDSIRSSIWNIVLIFISVFHMDFHLKFHVEIVPYGTPNKKIFFLKDSIRSSIWNIVLNFTSVSIWISTWNSMWKWFLMELRIKKYSSLKIPLGIPFGIFF